MNSLNRPKIVVSPPGLTAKNIIERASQILSPSLTRTAPLIGVEAEGVWVKDIDDNIYLDFGSGIAVVNVGHRHPEVIKAIKEQADKCDHINSCDYFTIPQVELAEKLIKITPGNFQKRVFY